MGPKDNGQYQHVTDSRKLLQGSYRDRWKGFYSPQRVRGFSNFRQVHVTNKMHILPMHSWPSSQLLVLRMTLLCNRCLLYCEAVFPNNTQHHLCLRTSGFILIVRVCDTCELDPASGKRQFLDLIRLNWMVLLDPHMGFLPIEIIVMWERNSQTTNGDYFNLFSSWLSRPYYMIISHSTMSYAKTKFILYLDLRYHIGITVILTQRRY